tara:strand:+ start:1172 stop:2770 length:1599 start_codon:yes stop_codon:yes gene_type:complete
VIALFSGIIFAQTIVESNVETIDDDSSSNTCKSLWNCTRCEGGLRFCEDISECGFSDSSLKCIEGGLCPQESNLICPENLELCGEELEKPELKTNEIKDCYYKAIYDSNRCIINYEKVCDLENLEEIETSRICEDFEGEINYDLRGIINLTLSGYYPYNGESYIDTFTFQDKCTFFPGDTQSRKPSGKPSFLTEYFCENNNLKSEQYECEFGCGTGQCLSQSDCISVLQNGDSTDKLDVVFLGDDYDESELGQFAIEVDNTITTLFSIEPFISNQEKFNFWRIDSTGNLDCMSDGMIRCDPRIVAAYASNCPHDQIIVLKNTLDIGGTFNNNQAYGPGRWPIVLIHEFSHSFGRLSDEYIAYDAGRSVIDSDSEEYISSNCDLATCDRWCSAVVPLNNLTNTGCTKVNEKECVGDGNYNICTYNGEECVNSVNNCISITDPTICENSSSSCVWIWDEIPDPYFESFCIPRLNQNINFGIDCMEGTGCYQGCNFRNWYRSVENGLMSSGNVRDIQPLGLYNEGLISDLLEAYN